MSELTEEESKVCSQAWHEFNMNGLNSPIKGFSLNWVYRMFFKAGFLAGFNYKKYSEK